MSHTSPLARPYARAIFELALVDNLFTKWSEMLAFIAALVKDAQVVKLLTHPKLTRQQASQLLLKLSEERLTEQGKNLICLLAENHRLLALPDIAKAFETIRADYEKTVEVKITSAAPLSDKQQQHLVSSLKKRLQRDVAIDHDVDKTLLGGAKVYIGDQVFDGSVRGRLQKLYQQLQN